MLFTVKGEIRYLMFFCMYLGSQIAQARLDARADWLELNESASTLLLRDRRRRLLLLDISSGKIVSE